MSITIKTKQNGSRNVLLLTYNWVRTYIQSWMCTCLDVCSLHFGCYQDYRVTRFEINEFSNAKTAELTFPVCEKRMSFVYERLSCWPGGYFNNNCTDGYPDYYMNILSMVFLDYFVNLLPLDAPDNALSSISSILVIWSFITFISCW